MWFCISDRPCGVINCRTHTAFARPFSTQLELQLLGGWVGWDGIHASKHASKPGKAKQSERPEKKRTKLSKHSVRSGLGARLMYVAKRKNQIDIGNRKPKSNLNLGTILYAGGALD